MRRLLIVLIGLALAALSRPALADTPHLHRAFAFGADSFTRDSYTKVVQNGENFLYQAARGYGYTEVAGIDTSLNDRGVLDGPGEIYDQFIGAKPGGSTIVFRIDLPNGLYRFVVAGGDPQYRNHGTTLRIRDGKTGERVTLVDSFLNPGGEFYRVVVDDKRPPAESRIVFGLEVASPALAVTQGFLEVHQTALEGFAAGGDVSVLEVWGESPPPMAVTPSGFVYAFAFGADTSTRTSPNAGVPYVKLSQNAGTLGYAASRGFGYTDLSGLDTTPNNRGMLSGDEEIYDQFIGAKPAGAKIVFRADVPNGSYRLVLAGGDPQYKDHRTTIRARDGNTGTFVTLVDGLRNPANEFYRIGFDDKRPPDAPHVRFLPLSTSPVIHVTKGFLEIHQIAAAGGAAGGDLNLLEIWGAQPRPIPEDFVAAFAFGADSFTRESPNAPVNYVKVVQDGLNFAYDASRGYGYTDLSGLDTSLNNRNVLDGMDEIYDQFIGAKPGGTSIVFRVDLPPGAYRFVAAGGDPQYKDHRTTIQIRDGDSGEILTLVEGLENPANEYYQVGFDGKAPPGSGRVLFRPLAESPTLVATRGFLEIHQSAGEGFAAGGDVNLFEIWKASASINRPPVAMDDEATTAEGVSVSVLVLANDADPDGDALTVEIASLPSNGTAAANPDGSVAYTPLPAAPGFFGDDAFTYKAKDGRGGEAIANVVVHVLPAPPDAVDDVASTLTGAPVAIDVLQNDRGRGLQVASVSDPAHGAAAIQSARVLYAPDPGFVGDDVFQYTILDDRGLTDAAFVRVAVPAPANRAPFAVPDAATVFENASIEIRVLDNDTDPDGDPLSVTSVTAAASGTTVLSSDGSVTYAPAVGFAGKDAFRYTIADTKGGAAEGVVSLRVLQDDVAPTIEAVVTPEPNSSGWHAGNVSVAFLCRDEESGLTHCPEPVAVTVESDAREVTGTASDRAGNTAAKSVVVRLDRSSPTLALSAPASARAGERVLVKATASDNLALASVRFLVDGSPVADLDEAPFEVSVAVPPGAVEGSLVAVEATATDRAENSATASLPIAVAGGGFVQGETYDDSRGLPLAGVSVVVGNQNLTTDALGRFATFTPSAAPTVIRFARDGFTPVERFVEVDALRGTLVLDARLTPLDPEGFVTLDASGGVVTAGAVRLEVSSGALSAPTAFRLTGVSSQGLRAPLPLGWSPLSSVEVEPDTALAVPAELVHEGAGPDVILARYDDWRHTWVARSSPIERTGAYAFVVADDGVLAPFEGEALAAAEPISVSFGLTATATVTPEVSPVSPDARATGSLSVSSIVPLPSGTLVSARVEESFDTFDQGEGEIRPEPFSQDLVLYRNGSSALSTSFPVTPTRKFTAEELRQGRVHVDIKTSPQRHRGSLVGAVGRLVEGEGGLSLSIPAGAVTASIAASVEPLETSELDFAFAGFPVVEGAEIDLGGSTLALPATLSIQASLASAENLFAARLLFVAGQRKLRLVGPALLENGALVVRGVETGGTYLVFQSEGPLALVTGIAREGFAPSPLVVVESSTTPFMDVTPASGAFVVAARLGVESTISGSSLRTGSHGSAAVFPATTDPLDIVLELAASGPFVTRVSPANGEKGVSRSAVVTVELSEAVAADTVTPSSFRAVRSSDGAPVAGRITLGPGRRSIALIPDSALESLTAYTVGLTSDVTDSAGNALLPFTSSFTTLAPDSDDFDPDAVKVSFPDAEGNVTVSASAGSFEAGASLTIVNVTNGVVVSSEVSFDGGFEIALRASYTDELQIRILDAAGREVVIEKTEYRAEDGRVAIGSKGGSVASGDFQLEVPEGAVATAAVFRLTPLTEDEIANLPLPEGAGGIGSAVRIETGGVILEEEADLSFPIPPEAPADALYLVLRAVEVSGELLYEVVDTASIEGGEDGKVRTNSTPFPGLLYPGDHVLNWYPLQPSLPKAEIGLIVGLAQETGGTAAKPSVTPLGNVEVRLEKPPARGDYVARTLSNGRFTMVDVGFGFSGTTVSLTGKTEDGRSTRATAFEGTGRQQGVSPKFNRTGEAVLNFPPKAPEPPPGRVAIRLFKTLGSVRQEIPGGFVAVGTDILFTIEFTDGASPPERVVAGVAGTSLAVTTVDEFHFEARFTPSDPRSYTLNVTAFDAFLREIFGDVSFLAVEGSTGNDQVVEGPPSILTSETSPKNGAKGIEVHPLFSVKFSEPVKNVTNETVKLQAAGALGDDTAVALELIGTGPSFGPAIPGPDSKVNSLTIRALEGLRFATRYELVFESGIVDTDASPNALSRTVLEFETLAPAELSNVTAEADPLAMATLGERVFLALQDERSSGSFGWLVAYDISDPQKPVKLEEAVLAGSGSIPRNSLFVGSMARDLKAEESVDVGIGRRDVVAVLSLAPRSGNAGLTLFDVSLTSPRYPYLGFVTTSVAGQFSSSFDLRGSFAYVAAGSLGLELVDLKKAVELFRAESPSGAYDIPFPVSLGLFSKGVGFGQSAIVRTVPIEVGAKTVRATVVEIAESSQGVVGLVGGFEPLETAGYLAVLSLATLGNPVVEGFVQLRVVLPEDQGVLELGVPTGVGFAELGGRELALVVGQGSVPGSEARVGRLAVVDVTDPKNPKLLSLTSLEGSNASGITLSGSDTVLVATPEGVESYSFLDPSRPRLVGKLPGIAGALGDLSLANEDAVLVSVGKNKELKLTALSVVPTLGIVPSPLVTGEETSIPADPAFGRFREILQPGNFVVGRIPEEFEVTTAEVELLRGTTAFATLPATVLPDGQILVRFEPGAALPMPSPRMRAVLNRGTALEKSSASEPVSFAPLLFGVKKKVPVVVELDPVNGSHCLRFADTIAYGLNLSAQVTISTVVAGTERVLFDGAREVEPGAEALFEESVDDDLSLFSMVAGSFPYKVRARLASDPSVVVEQGGSIELELATHGVLPVGSTFVKGVNLFDGHLVVSSTDASIPGRIPLEIARTYASAGIFSDESALGVGWSFNYGATLIATDCFVTVVGGDGTGQRFVRSGDRFLPQKGYHGELRLNPDGSYDFFTKGRVRYHLVDTPKTEGAVVFRGLNPTLEFIEEPNGNKLLMLYDGLSRLSKVQEEDQSGKAGRALELHYSQDPIRRKYRIESITGPMGLVVSYGYDELGNLVRATRGERTERYEYSIDLLDQHNMTARVDPNGHRTEYVYFEDGDNFPGEEPGAPIGQKYEYVKEVREPEGVTTSFEYDFGEISSFRWIRRVTDGRGFLTSYVLNGNGSPLEIEEPSVEGKRILTTMVWASNDIHKLEETDAKGRLTRFEYDDRGNLTQEIIVAGGDIGTVETEFRYDRLFNKMTYKKDAEGRETFFEIDETNGNLLSVKDAEGNVTRYDYFPNGDLMRMEGPRAGQVSDFQPDEFGNPETTTDALGNETTTDYDQRSRLRSSTDTMGRRMSQDFDDLDRLTLVNRFDDLGSSDEEVIERTYYPGGEVLTEKNGLGLVTTYVIDGLNRVIRAEERLSDRVLVSSLLYDENSNLKEKTDRRGVRTVNTWDALNRLEKVDVMGQTVSTFEYDEVGNKIAETDLYQSRTVFEPDELYRVKRRLLPTAHEERFVYDRVGNKTSETDANGKTTLFKYDGLNRLTERTDAVGNVARFDYDGSGNRTLEEDVTRGLSTSTLYDFLNRPETRTVTGADPDGFVYLTTFDYDDDAHTVVETDPRGFRKTAQLDGFDRVHQVSQETGEELLETTSFYDANGNLKKSLDAEGRETELVYDERSRLIEVHHPLSLTSRYSYDGEGNKLEEVNRRGIATRFDYDNLGRLVGTEIDQPITGGGTLKTSEVTYLDNERKRVERNARGHTHTFEMDAQGRVTKLTDPEGFSQTFEYDGVNKVAELDKKGRRTQFEYDGIHRLTKVTDALSQSISTTYLDAARQIVETDKRGIEKRTELDALGRLVSVTRSGVVLEQHQYDGTSNRILSVDANGNRARFVYDGANRLTSRIDALGTQLATRTTFLYDKVGNLLEQKDGRITGRPFDVRNVYDDLNRLETTADGEGNVTTYDYDPEGNRTLVLEPKSLDHRTDFEYGELNELIEVRMPDGGVYSYKYDPNRNRIEQRDGEGNVVTSTYDKLNRLETMIQDPGGFNLITNHEYDPNGNEIKLTDPKGQLIDFDYDELNRLKFKSYNLTAEDFALFTRTHRIDYIYNPNDDVERIDETKSSGTDPPAVVSSFKTYDDLDRLETETDAWGRPLFYDYDGQGNRTLLIDPDNKRTVYSYDELNRLETLTLDDQQAVTYEYFPDGLKKQVTNPNGTVSTYLYDAADRMDTITHVGPSGTISGYEYFYDAGSNRERQVEQNAGRTETTEYTYDFVNRLKTVTYPDRSTRYEYDLAGNRIQEVTTGAEASDETFHYDAINRLERITDNLGDEDVVYSYDPNGNITSKTVAGVTTNFLFDIRDQLGEVRQGSNILGRYGYDYQGRRILKIGDDGRRQYTYDQLSVITEADQVNATVSKYDYGMDQLVRLDNRGEGRSFFHLDGLRSTVSLTDAAGGSRQSIFYDAWGNERDRIGASANNFTFTGHELDEETDLVYAKGRFYDSEVGRFVSQDSILGKVSDPSSLHRYVYGRSNPGSFVDLNGREAVAMVPAMARGELAVQPFTPQQIGAETFAVEFTTRAFNLVTLYGPKSLSDAYQEGRISPRDSWWRGFYESFSAYFGGATNTLTFGAVEGYVEARAGEGKTIAGSTGSAALTSAKNVTAVSDVQVILDENTNSWEKAEAGATAVAKWATLGSVGSSLSRGRASGTVRPNEPVNSPKAEVVSETAGEVLGTSQATGGPVTFRPPPNATPEQIAQARAYCQLCNEALEAGELSGTGRVSTKGALRREATRSAASERARAAEEGAPYEGHAGHVPDTTWTGNPEPSMWLDLDPTVNTSLGGQAGKYPVGYKPTEFILEGIIKEEK